MQVPYSKNYIMVNLVRFGERKFVYFHSLPNPPNFLLANFSCYASLLQLLKGMGNAKPVLMFYHIIIS